MGLWGRSMGAAASLFFMKENPGMVKAAALDSGFSNLKDVVKSMGS